MSQRNFRHVRQVLHQIFSSMSKSSCQTGQKAKKDQRPNSEIGSQKVINVNSSLGCHDQIDHENKGQKCEGDGRFIRLHWGPFIYYTRTQHFHTSHDSCSSCQNDQTKQKSRPEPVVVHSFNCRFSQGHSDQPESFASDLSGCFSVFDVFDVQNLLVKGHTNQGKNKEHS